MSKIIYAESFELRNGFSYMHNAVNAAYSMAKEKLRMSTTLNGKEDPFIQDIDELSVRRNEDGSFHVNFKVFMHDTQRAQTASGDGAGKGQANPASGSDAG